MTWIALSKILHRKAVVFHRLSTPEGPLWGEIVNNTVENGG